MGQPHYDSGRGRLLPQPLQHLEDGKEKGQLECVISLRGFCLGYEMIIACDICTPSPPLPLLLSSSPSLPLSLSLFQVVSEKLDRVLIFEDDADFVPQFREILAKVLSEAEEFTPNWDLM